MANVGEEIESWWWLIGQAIAKAMVEHSEKSGCRYQAGAVARIKAKLIEAVEEEEVCMDDAA